MKQLVAGNWKMNGAGNDLSEIEALKKLLASEAAGCDVLICPPATLVARAASVAAGTPLAIGGQDCHAKVSGAHTGDISAAMLKDAGAIAVIVGHSERRQDHGETDAAVSAKASAALATGLITIVCVGETEAERMAGKALDIVAGQIAGSVPKDAKATTVAVAYEPVWAIGTGKTPTSAEIAEMHGHIRARLKALLPGEGAVVRILYGGSVKPSNAAEILGLPEVGGALVGGASLKAADFIGIIRASGKTS